MSELSRLKDVFKGRAGKIIFAVGIIAILFIYLSSLLPSGGDSTKKTQSTESTELYCEQLEKKVEKLVSGITGSKNVSVVITLDSGKQYVYADEGRTTKTASTDDKEQNYTIVRSADGDETGLLVTEYLPTVRGVAIVCESMSQTDYERIRSAVTAALNITSKKVYVTQYGN